MERYAYRSISIAISQGFFFNVSIEARPRHLAQIRKDMYRRHRTHIAVNIARFHGRFRAMRVGASVLLYLTAIFTCKRVSSEEKVVMSGDGKRKRNAGSGELASAAASGSASTPSLYFVNTKRTYRTAEELYDAVCKAQRTGTAKWWKQVSVSMNAGTVKLFCKQCGGGFSARNPADSCSKHFEQKDGSYVCKKRMEMRSTVEAHGTVADLNEGPSCCWCIRHCIMYFVLLFILS